MQGLRHQSGNKHPTKNGCVWKKLLKCWYTLNVTQCVEKIFFWFYRSVGFEGNIKYFKKRNYISYGVHWPRSFHFRYVTNEIAHFVSLQSLFLHKLQSWMYLQFGEYFLWVWASEANFLAVFSKRVRRFQEKLNIFWGKQECSVCVNTGGKPSRSKISRG